MEDVNRLKAIVPESETSTLYFKALGNVISTGEVDAVSKMVSEIEGVGLKMRTHMYYPLVARLAQQNNVKGERVVEREMPRKHLCRWEVSLRVPLI